MPIKLRILAAGFTLIASESAEAQQKTFTPVVGHWTAVTDGGAAFKVDGEKWGGSTPRAYADSIGRALFGTANPTFVANVTAGQAFPLAVVGDVKSFSTGTLRVRFKLAGGASDQIAGIVFGLQPNGEYYFARYNTKDGNVAIWRYADSTRTRVAEGTAHKQLALNAWHELVVTIAGSKVTCTTDGGTLSVEHTFTQPVAGRVGVWAKRDAISVFRDFTATPAK
jgi:hypothetical protein